MAPLMTLLLLAQLQPVSPINPRMPSAPTWTLLPDGGVAFNVYNYATNTCSGGGASPLTTKGDIYTYSTVDARLPVGTDGLCLTADSAQATGLLWSACGSGGGAPTTASFITKVAEGSLSNEFAMGSLGTGLVVNTTATGVPSIYAGSSCGANQYAASTNASGALTCTQPAFSGISGSVAVTQGGTGVGSRVANDVVMGTGANTTATSVIPSCSNGTNDKLLYNNVTQAFTCGADQTGGGGGAPTTATYLTATAEAGLSAEVNLGALTTGMLKHTVSAGTSTPATATAGTDYGPPTSGNATGLILNTTGTGAHTTYSGASCTNQFPRALSASGAPTCASVASADLSITATSCTNQFVSAVSTTGVGTCTTDTIASAQHANQGTTTTTLHGNAAGNPAWSAVVSADLNVTTTSCTNQFVSAIGSGATGTCTTSTLAGAQHANQGTTTTVLHGNAAGNPSWAGVSLTADTTANQGATTTLLHGNAAGQPTFGGVSIADHTATGTPSSTTFLRGDNTWSAPPGGGVSVTTKGDLQTFDTAAARLPVGADALCLKANSGTGTGLEWGTCAAGGSGLTYAEVSAASLAGF